MMLPSQKQQSMMQEQKTGAGATTALMMNVTDEEGFATATDSVDFARIRLTVLSASNSEQQ